MSGRRKFGTSGFLCSQTFLELGFSLGNEEKRGQEPDPDLAWQSQTSFSEDMREHPISY